MTGRSKFKKWLWDDGLIPIFNSIGFLIALPLFAVISILGLALRIVFWSLDHGATAIKILFWFFASLIGVFYCVAQFINPFSVFTLSISAKWVYGLIFILYFYIFTKYASSQWKSHMHAWLIIQKQIDKAIVAEKEATEKND